MRRRCMLAVLASLATATPAVAQQPEEYVVPRTPHGDPDIQGVWATEFLTTLERPVGIDKLVASPEQAHALVEAMRTDLPEVIDPQVLDDDLQQLLMVKGEYRTSVIVAPEDGKMPFTPAGEDLAARILMRNDQMFDDVTTRPLAERCMENFGYPPMRAIFVSLPHQIFQTRDHVVIVSEGPAAVRMIHLDAEPPAEALRSVQGNSTAHWEGDTLVVHTTHLRAQYPARDIVGRPLLLSPDSTITERFTRVSDAELNYQFTVEDDELYAEPWTGEFSLAPLHGPIYEYACHEGNYSIPLILNGARTQEREAVNAR